MNDFLANCSEEWVAALQEAWRRDADSLPADWRAFFSGFALGTGTAATETLPPASLSHRDAEKLTGVHSLVSAYRTLGHLMACVDPLSPCRLAHPLLELSNFGLDENDLETVFPLGRLIGRDAPLRDVIRLLTETYCRELGVEFMHMDDLAERSWLIERMESCRNRSGVSRDERLLVLEKLHEASHFEAFLQRRFPGQKRFSLEGGEVLIPLLDSLARGAAEAGISDAVLGMAHRGRLNVLAHLFGKPYENILAEFRDELEAGFPGEGDVKYHKGYSSEREVNGRRIHLTLAANPSHLEAVNGVVEGKCRARQHRYGTGGARRVLPVLIHGDAAFAGQGSVMEVLNMSQLEGYGTGGTIHVIINNQIGFTTLPRDSRSTRYATDTAKMLACPVFHVQGEAPEAAQHAARLALEYRQTFGRDVVIELLCYRRHGHNEGDEPAFTQPLMYRQISERPTLNRIYADTLAGDGFEAERLERLERQVLERLEGALSRQPQQPPIGYKNLWSGFESGYREFGGHTSVSREKLLELSSRLAEVPSGFTPHAKILSLVRGRNEAVRKGGAIDWGNGEMLACASLLDEGVPVRLSGQDSRRGTFNHRHCVLHDVHTGAAWTPLMSAAAPGATFQVWNSLLSEFGVLGFEYGYSLETPGGLVIWEAQFGDFANGAQVIIDQFIAGGEGKWNRASGLVMLLPHGYEGQGAEHSSARIERFLQLCAGDNMIVACPTTPAQIFHLLRRQVLQPFRKPLVVFTPKSYLRHPVCVSPLEELCDGRFHHLRTDEPARGQASRILLCCGKLVHELRAERERLGRSDIAIASVEQLYPFSVAALGELLERHPGADLLWVQEEPHNMGAWHHVCHCLAGSSRQLRYVGRPACAAPATGSHHTHAREQAALIGEAFAG